MSFTTRMASTGSGLLDRVLCVAGAVFFSQAPEFMQQYAQRLGGHVNEARLQVAQYERVATESGMSLERFITHTETNPDATVSRLGSVMHQSTERLRDLENSQQAIMDSGLFGRPFAFLQHLDTEIAQATWTVYKPAVPTTVEGLVYAIAGMALILGLYHLFFRIPVEFGYNRWKRKKAIRMAEA